MIGRRGFVKDMALAGVAGMLGFGREAFAAEPPPETTRLRIADSTALCFAPQFVEELLRAEGFTDFRFVQRKPEVSSNVLLGAGEADISFGLAPNLILSVDAGEPVVLLAGGHVGCYELFASRRIQTIRDLKGKVVSIPRRGGGSHIFLQMILAYIGIDPRKGVEWREVPWAKTLRLLEEDKIDAFLGFPPEPQELRARKIGHVIFNTTTDRPWSQYFCCMVGANSNFVRRHPVATKRALRAILKGTDLCATDPERTARAAAAHSPTSKYEYVLQMMKELRFGAWRDISAEDSARFYALRMHETGMIKLSPNKLLSVGTDWRFLNELKKELKA